MKKRIILAIALSIVMGHQAKAASSTALHSWDTKIADASKRFVILADFNNEAVLDSETGLVWEQSPSSDADWAPAFGVCINKVVGNRMGWRLPTIQELMSLIDPSVPVAFPNLRLPPGHPFTNISPTTGGYWSANAAVTGGAWLVGFVSGTAAINCNTTGCAKTIWCVRGGQGLDTQ